MTKYLSLIPFVVLVLAAASTGAQFLPGEWYLALNKPAWTPPNWVFPIAWSVLYVMIAIAGWLAWRAFGVGVAIVIWAVGLALNALWSYLMFGRHEIGLALGDIALLWVATASFILATKSQAPLAAALFGPYLLWISFAAALNFEIWRIN